MLTRVCKECKEEKSLEDYAKHPTCVLGRLHVCKRCDYKKRYKPKGPCKDNPSWFKKGHKCLPGSEKGWIKKGQRLSQKTEFKKGQKPHNFIDGKSKEFFNLTNTKRYTKLRLQVLERDEYKCKRCEKKSNILHVHHIIKRRDAIDKIMDVNNLITVCPKCHVKLEMSKQ